MGCGMWSVEGWRVGWRSGEEEGWTIFLDGGLPAFFPGSVHAVIISLFSNVVCGQLSSPFPQSVLCFFFQRTYALLLPFESLAGHSCSPWQASGPLPAQALQRGTLQDNILAAACKRIATRENRPAILPKYIPWCPTVHPPTHLHTTRTSLPSTAS